MTSVGILTTSCKGHCDQFTPCIIRKTTGVECLRVQDSNVDGNGTFVFRFSPEISAVGAVELDPNTTHVVLTDGYPSDEVSRGELVNIFFDPTFVIAGEEITDVTILNLNISSADRLLSILPKGTVNLWLENTLMMEFPTVALLQLRSLSDLNLDSNFIEEIGTGTYSDSLQSL
ncbi:hypothetical protein V7S43_013102 [Phytophthora oleae]|uniref:Uncharacterized protein n=1 Tax=Phytophthora oleae TaxID=2107226 RepID=A0ABD3F516_9STRA